MLLITFNERRLLRVKLKKGGVPLRAIRLFSGTGLGIELLCYMKDSDIFFQLYFMRDI